jgi:flagellar export protein FliJ
MNIAALRQYRRRLEDMLRAELTVLERALEESGVRCRDLHRTANHAADRYHAELREGLSCDEIIDRTREIDGLTAASRRAAAEMGYARERWEQKRSDVVEAARERKTLELLEQRRMRQQMSRLRRLEQQAIDEAAHLRFLKSVRAEVDHES